MDRSESEERAPPHQAPIRKVAGALVTLMKNLSGSYTLWCAARLHAQVLLEVIMTWLREHVAPQDVYLPKGEQKRRVISEYEKMGCLEDHVLLGLQD